MIPYLLLFGIVATMAMRPWSRLHGGVFLLLVLMIGLRHQVGGDWDQYIVIYHRYAGKPLAALLGNSEPGYVLINWLSYQLGWDTHGTNLLCALIFTYGLWQFCRAQPLPALALVVAIPYLVIVVAMGYTRQGVAIGLGMLALLAVERQQWIRFVICVLAAATFHKTAVILMGFGLALSGRGWWWRVPLMSFVAFEAYQAILAESLGSYLRNYEAASYQSQGAIMRVAMNVLPAVMFLRWHAAMSMPDGQRRLWLLLSRIALAMPAALIIMDSSTAVDRVALYLIPLQLFVWSRMPLRHGRLSMAWVQYAVIYSFIVLMIWLLLAANASAWLPYQFFPFWWLTS